MATVSFGTHSRNEVLPEYPLPKEEASAVRVDWQDKVLKKTMVGNVDGCLMISLSFSASEMQVSSQ